MCHSPRPSPSLFFLLVPIVKEHGSVNLNPFPASCLYESRGQQSRPRLALALFQVSRVSCDFISKSKRLATALVPLGNALYHCLWIRLKAYSPLVDFNWPGERKKKKKIKLTSAHRVVLSDYIIHFYFYTYLDAFKILNMGKYISTKIWKRANKNVTIINWNTVLQISNILTCLTPTITYKNIPGFML